MGLEAATLIHQLDVNNPVGGTDQVLQGDDHLRMIKTCLRNTFANFAGAVTVTDAQINTAVAAVLAALPFPTSGRVDNPVVTNVLNFTPTGTAANNELHWIRVGNIVMCTGQIRGGMVAGPGTGHSFRIALPVASAIATDVDDLNGVATGPGLSSGKIIAGLVNDDAVVSFTNDTALTICNLFFHFSYRVL